MGSRVVRRFSTAGCGAFFCVWLILFFFAHRLWAQNPPRVIDCSAPAAIPAVIHVVRGDLLLFTGTISDTSASTTFTVRGRYTHDTSDPFLGVRPWQLAWDTAKPYAKSGTYILSYSKDGGPDHRMAEFDIVILDQSPFQLTTISSESADSLTAKIAPTGASSLRAVSYDLVVDGRVISAGLDGAKPGSVDLTSQEPGDHALWAMALTPEGGVFATNSIPFSVGASVQMLGLDKSVTVDRSDPAKPVAPLPFRYKADPGIDAQTLYLVVDGQNMARYDLPTRAAMQLDPSHLTGGSHTVRLLVIADDGERFESLPVSLQVVGPVNYQKIDGAASQGVQVHPYLELAMRVANADTGELAKIKAGDDAVADLLRPVAPPATPLEAWWDAMGQAGIGASLSKIPLPQDIAEDEQDILRQAAAEAGTHRESTLHSLRQNGPVLDILKKYKARDLPAERFAHGVALASFQATQKIGRTSRAEFDSLTYWQWVASHPQAVAEGSLNPVKAATETDKIAKFAAAQVTILGERNTILSAEAEALPLLLQTPVSDRATKLCRDIAEAAARGEAALAPLGVQDGITAGSQRRLTFNVHQGSQWFETHAALTRTALNAAQTIAFLSSAPGYWNPDAVDKSNGLLTSFSRLLLGPDEYSAPLSADNGEYLGVKGLHQSLFALANVWGLKSGHRESDSPRSLVEPMPAGTLETQP